LLSASFDPLLAVDSNKLFSPATWRARDSPVSIPYRPGGDEPYNQLQNIPIVKTSVPADI